MSNGAYKAEKERSKKGKSETRANDFPANVSVLLNDGSEIDFQNDYTRRTARGNFLPRRCPRPHLRRCRRRKKAASPLRFLFDPRA